MNQPYFKQCSTCKTPIGYEEDYFRCSVSTCNRKRTELYFCSVPCWDAHVPGARHRDAWAEPARAPSASELAAAQAEPPKPETTVATRRKVAGATSSDDQFPQEVLVVVSKLKAYIRARSGMNTSDGVTGVLSAHLRSLCVEAIRVAAQDERKTVLDRDFAAVLSKR
jgi:hypothetical protein